MRPVAKVAVVIGGYVVAIVIASITVTVWRRLTDTADAQAAGGMYAFGDTLMFFFTFAVAAIPASGAALYFLRPVRVFWTILATIAIAIASTAVAAGLAYAFARTSAWGAFSVLRIFATFGFAIAFLVATLFAPRAGARWALLAATATEAAVGAYGVIAIFVR